jgi:alkylated DNA repair dioxygenase AlkB
MAVSFPVPTGLLQNVDFNVLLSHEKGLLIEVDFSDILPELILASQVVVSHLDWYRPFSVYGKPARMLRGIVDMRDDVLVNPSPLTFSRQQFFPVQMMPEVKTVQEIITKKMGVNFNACLANKYVSPEDHISPHADNENTVMAEFGVMSISTGPGSRVFEIQEQKHGRKWRFVSRPGYGLLMYGPDFQKTFFHAVLKIKIPPHLWTNLSAIPDKNATKERTSLTFRRHDEKIAAQNEKKRIVNSKKRSIPEQTAGNTQKKAK